MKKGGGSKKEVKEKTKEVKGGYRGRREEKTGEEG